MERNRKTLLLDLGLLLLFALAFIWLQLQLGKSDPIDKINTRLINGSINYLLNFQHNPWKIDPHIEEYPPLMPYACNLFYALFGFSLTMTYLASLSFSLILVFALYGLGRLLGGRIVGWMTVFLTLGNFQTLLWSRTYNLNFSEMAVFNLTIFFLYYLLLNRGFADRRYAILFGLVLGVSLLGKYTYLFLPVPLLMGLYLVYREGKQSEIKSRLTAGAFAALLAGSGCLIYLGFYFVKLSSFFMAWQLLNLLLVIVLAWGWNRYLKNLSAFQNFLLSLGLAALILIPWYACNLDIPVTLACAHLLKYHTEEPPFFFNSLQFFINCFKTVFPGSLWFFGLGAAYTIFNRKKETLGRLTFWTFTAILCLHYYTLPNRLAYRYFLAMEPLAVLLSIYWLKKLPRIWQWTALALSFLWLAFNLTASDPFLSPRNPLYPLAKSYLVRVYQPFTCPDPPNPRAQRGARALEPQVYRDMAQIIKTREPFRPLLSLYVIYLDPLDKFAFDLKKLDADLIKGDYLPLGALNDFYTLHLSRDLREPNLSSGLLLVSGAQAADFAPWEKTLRERGVKYRLEKEYRYPEGLLRCYFLRAPQIIGQRLAPHYCCYPDLSREPLLLDLAGQIKRVDKPKALNLLFLNRFNDWKLSLGQIQFYLSSLGIKSQGMPKVARTRIGIGILPLHPIPARKGFDFDLLKRMPGWNYCLLLNPEGESFKRLEAEFSSFDYGFQLLKEYPFPDTPPSRQRGILRLYRIHPLAPPAPLKKENNS